MFHVSVKFTPLNDLLFGLRVALVNEFEDFCTYDPVPGM